MSWRAACATGAVLLLAGADYLGGSGLGQTEVALLRLLLPTTVLATLVGLLAGPGTWMLAGGGTALYAGLQIAGAFHRGMSPDWSYACLPIAAAIMGGFGEAVRQAHTDSVVSRMCRQCLASANEAEQDIEFLQQVSRMLKLDKSVLTESGLVKALLREDAEACRQARFVGYALILCLIAVYHVSGAYWALWLALTVLACSALAAMHRFVVSERPPLAFDSLLAGYYELAALEFTEAVQANERDVKARIGLGIAQLHLGCFDKAVSHFDAARRVATDRFTVGVWAGVERLMGVALRNAKKPTLAARSLRNVLALFPEHPQTLYDLGLCYLDNGLRRQAMELFERAAKLGHPRARAQIRTVEEAAVVGDRS